MPLRRRWRRKKSSPSSFARAADPNAGGGAALLHAATSLKGSSSLACVNLLIDAKADVLFESKFGLLAADHAAAAGDDRCAARLREHAEESKQQLQEQHERNLELMKRLDELNNLIEKGDRCVLKSLEAAIERCEKLESDDDSLKAALAKAEKLRTRLRLPGEQSRMARMVEDGGGCEGGVRKR